MANKNGHWYTDKQGNHYFVEDGQSPKEGWEASKQRKMISGGKYQVSDDGNDYREVDKDEYDRYEADDADFDENNDDDFGFDEEEDMPEYEYSEIFSDSADKQIERYAEHYGVDASELKDEIYQKALDKIREGDSLSNARNDAMEEVLDSLDPGSSPLDNNDEEYNREMQNNDGYKIVNEGPNKVRVQHPDGYTHYFTSEKEANEYVKSERERDADKNKGNPYDPEDLPDEGLSPDEYKKEMTKAQEENAMMSEGEDEPESKGIPHEPVDMPKYHNERGHIVIDEGPHKGESYDSEEDFRNSVREEGKEFNINSDFDEEIKKNLGLPLGRGRNKWDYDEIAETFDYDNKVYKNLDDHANFYESLANDMKEDDEYQKHRKNEYQSYAKFIRDNKDKLQKYVDDSAKSHGDRKARRSLEFSRSFKDLKRGYKNGDFTLEQLKKFLEEED